jgi:hypothetical protein
VACRYGLDIAVESCMPNLMLESYLNMAELRLLQGENFEAIAYWWEVRSAARILLAWGWD